MPRIERLRAAFTGLERHGSRVLDHEFSAAWAQESYRHPPTLNAASSTNFSSGGQLCGGTRAAFSHFCGSSSLSGLGFGHFETDTDGCSSWGSSFRSSGSLARSCGQSVARRTTEERFLGHQHRGGEEIRARRGSCHSPFTSSVPDSGISVVPETTSPSAVVCTTPTTSVSVLDV